MNIIHSIRILFLAFYCCIISCQHPLLSNSCKSQSNQLSDSSKLVGQYITDILQDSKGVFWFATLDNGLVKYNGNSLDYITKDDGLVSNAITSLVENPEGNLWVGTQNGISLIKNDTIIKYEMKPNCDLRISDLYLDSNGRLWITTWDGVCIYDNDKFVSFNLPKPRHQKLDYTNLF